MGSTALERSGHRVIAYDARGHGHSAPRRRRTPTATSVLADDLLAVLDERGHRARGAGRRLDGRAHDRRVRARAPRARRGGLVLITPAFDPEDATEAPGPLGPARRRACAGRRRGLRRGLRPTRRSRRRSATRSARPAPAPGRARASRRASPTPCGQSRARARSSARRPRAHRGADDRGRQPRRGRSRASLRDRRALRRGDPAARSCAPRSPGSRRSPGRAASSPSVIADLAGSVRPAA